MTTVLGIDTAGPVVGACLSGPGVEREWSERVSRGADTVLIPAIADMLGSGILDAVAVSVGPGAFTGLRVGVSAALGIAVSRRISVVCISSLEARAALVDDASVLALLDARKSRVYAQWFDCSTGTPQPRNDAQDAPLQEVIPDQAFVAVGEGAMLDPERLILAGGVICSDPAQSAARAVARLGIARISQGLPPHEVALSYLRDADAKKQV
jgi:tRNA threonylcarbamoyladenosine biosynthesis protein TsaB